MNRQDKNQLGSKNQINNDQIGQISFKNRQDKNNLTLRTKMAVTKNVLKVKFDCTYFNITKKVVCKTMYSSEFLRRIMYSKFDNH